MCPLDHLPPAYEWPSRKTKLLPSLHAESLLLTIYGRLGQASTTGDRRVQQHREFHYKDQATQNFNKKALPLTLFYPEYEGEKDSAANMQREAIKKTRTE